MLIRPPDVSTAGLFQCPSCSSTGTHSRSETILSLWAGNQHCQGSGHSGGTSRPPPPLKEPVDTPPPLPPHTKGVSTVRVSHHGCVLRSAAFCRSARGSQRYSVLVCDCTGAVRRGVWWSWPQAPSCSVACFHLGLPSLTVVP